MNSIKLMTRYGKDIRLNFLTDGRIYAPGDVEITPRILKHKLTRNSIQFLAWNRNTLYKNAGIKIIDSII